ncbi:MAG: GTPase HflX [Bacillota bacterium]
MEKKVNGSVQGIRSALLERMAELYDFVADGFAPRELLERMAEYTGLLGREVSVYLSRDGRVADVSIGDSMTVAMPEMRLVRNEDRLCGVRCIHTHPNGDATLSGVDLGTLRSMRLDAMCSLGVYKGCLKAFYAAFMGEMKDGERTALIYGPFDPLKLPQRALMEEIRAADQRLFSTTRAVEENRPERAILVGLNDDEGYDSMAELAELASTAGAQVVGKSVQKRRTVDNATYIGSGKAEELTLLGSELEAELYIFDDELNAVQLRNLEEILGARVIDRTALILDIFAARANTREGKLQVELAQLQYRLPRLTGIGGALSRQGGGIGTRGPGEKKLEIDRRRIKRRIFELEQELEEIKKQRELRRARRQKNEQPLVALVGYTNAGKSTLLNALSGSDVLAEDKLFATLDPVVRQVTLPGGTEALLSDTVGFINKLPHDLVQAFHSTLEEVSNADLILHVIDASSSYFDVQMSVVEDVLSELHAIDTPRINVYNKQDKPDACPVKKPDSVLISAKTGEGIGLLLERIEAALNSGLCEVELLIPYDRYQVLQLIRAEGRILSEAHEETGTRIAALLSEATRKRLESLLKRG